MKEEVQTVLLFENKMLPKGWKVRKERGRRKCFSEYKDGNQLEEMECKRGNKLILGLPS